MTDKEKLEAAIKFALDYLADQGLLRTKAEPIEGLRCLGYDSQDFINDKETPCEMLYRPATVTKFYFDRYGRLCVNLKYDHGRESSNFAEVIKPLHQKLTEGE